MKMIGNTVGNKVLCKCCIAPSWRKTLKRGAKRAERQAWKRDLRSV